MLQLIHYRLCPFSRAIRLALAELKHDTELSEELPWQWRPEILAINPAGELPIVQVDGQPPLCGLYAISEYLAEDNKGDRSGFAAFPLLSGDRLARAESRRLIDWFNRKFHDEAVRDLLDVRAYAVLRGADRETPDLDLLRSARQAVHYHLSYVAHLTGTGTWLCGDDLTFSDLVAGAHLSCLDYLGEVPWETQPAAKDWYARLKSRPSFRPILGERILGLPSPPDHYEDPDF